MSTITLTNFLLGLIAGTLFGISTTLKGIRRDLRGKK